MTSTFKTQAAALAVIMKILSVVCTGWLFFSLTVNPWIGGLTAIGGAVIQWLAFLVTPLGLLWLIQRQWFRGISALTYGVFVFGVSTGAAVAFLEQGERLYQKGSDHYALNSSLIELRTEAARKDIEKGWRERGLATLDKIAAQGEKQQNLGSDSPLSQLAELYGVSGEQVRRLAFLVFALLLDGGAIMASCLLALESREKPELTKEEVFELGVTMLSDPVPKEQERSSGTEEREHKNNNKMEEATELIRSKRAGETISVRNIKDRLKVGYNKAKNIIEQLEQQQLIRLDGKVYRVTGE